MSEKLGFKSALLSIAAAVILIGSGAFGTVLVMLRDGDVKRVDRLEKTVEVQAQQILDTIAAVQRNTFEIKFIGKELQEIEKIKSSQAMIQSDVNQITIEMTKISSHLEVLGSK